MSFYWLEAFLNVGFSRPLERDSMWFIYLCRTKPSLLCRFEIDLWELPRPRPRHTNTIMADVELDFYLRCPSNKRPASCMVYLRILLLVTRSSAKQIPEARKKATSLEMLNLTKQSKLRIIMTNPCLKPCTTLFFKRVWVSGFLLVISGKRNSTFRNVSVFL